MLTSQTDPLAMIYCRLSFIHSANPNRLCIENPPPRDLHEREARNSVLLLHLLISQQPGEKEEEEETLTTRHASCHSAAQAKGGNPSWTNEALEAAADEVIEKLLASSRSWRGIELLSVDRSIEIKRRGRNLIKLLSHDKILSFACCFPQAGIVF